MNDTVKLLTVDKNCIFCKIFSGQIPSEIIHQTDHSIVVKDIAPKAPVHYLIIPKNHIQDLASCIDPVVLLDLMAIPGVLSRQLGERVSFKLLTNNGYEAGQRIFHLHFHFMAGKIFNDDV
jgi:histidine triad (HIT) family protein